MAAALGLALNDGSLSARFPPSTSFYAEIALAVVLANFINGDDRGVIEECDGLGLVLKSLHFGRVSQDAKALIIFKATARLRLTCRGVNNAHATAAHFLLYLIIAEISDGRAAGCSLCRRGGRRRFEFDRRDPSCVRPSVASDVASKCGGGGLDGSWPGQTAWAGAFGSIRRDCGATIWAAVGVSHRRVLRERRGFSTSSGTRPTRSSFPRGGRLNERQDRAGTERPVQAFLVSAYG